MKVIVVFAVFQVFVAALYAAAGYGGGVGVHCNLGIFVLLLHEEIKNNTKQFGV